MTTRSEIASPPHSTASVPDRWDALFDAKGRELLERELPRYMAERRWYRTKTKRIESATIKAAFPLPYGDSVARIALVDVVHDGGARDTYVLPLAWVRGDDAAAIRERRAHAVVLPLRVTSSGSAQGEARADDGLVVDALAFEPFLDALLAAIARGGTIEDAGWTLRFHGSALAEKIATEAPASSPVDREQTNTSILYGEALVAKIVRKLDDGEGPDLEIGRFLTSAGYAHSPALAGWIDVFRTEPAAKGNGGSRGPAPTLGVVHAFVPNRGDAWGHALEVLGGWLDAAGHRAGKPPALTGDVLSCASAPLPAEVSKAIGEYEPLAALLGERVGAMHVALASRPDDPTFAPERLAPAALASVAKAAASDLTRALTLLGARSNDLSDDARTALAGVRSGVRALERRLADLAKLPDAGIVTRVHGDLHLGQILFTGSDFAIIDFEGEPGRSLEERRSKRSPLVDVAGMLRSFHYASVAALRAMGQVARAGLAPWAELWRRAASASFLRGWLLAVDGSVVVPADPTITRALLDLFLLEKGIYELAYEMNNRPDWVAIPLDGLRELMDEG